MLLNFNLIGDIVMSISKKNQFPMKIEPVTCIWMFVCMMNFWAARNGKKWNFGLFRPNLREFGLFHPYIEGKWSFTEISMIKIVILDQSKPISQMFKIENSKIQKSEICKLHVYYTKKHEISQVYNPF